MVIRSCDALVRPGDLRERVDVEIEGNRIADVRPTGAEPAATARVLDGRGLLAMPGLVNAHTHSPENCLRGAGEGLPLEVWLIRMFGTAGRFDPDDHYTCALAGAVEMLLTGTTAVLDHLWGTPPTVEGVGAVLRAYRDAGLRAAVAPLVADADFTGALAESHGYDLSGALFTDLAGAVPVDDAVAQLDELIAGWHDRRGRMLQVFAGPVGAQWCSDELLQRLAETAERHESGLTLHLLETSLQDRVARHRFGASALAGLDRLGVLGPRCSLAHGVWLDGDDIGLLAEREVVVVHNPSANLRLGSGRAPVRDLLDAGVTVALGADGSSSSDNQVLWTQLKLAALVHNDGERWVSSRDALAMATRGGAAALGLEHELGALEPGGLADLALLDRSGLGLAGAHDVEAALALSETGRGVVHVLVGGELVVEHGRCVRVDQDALRAAWREQAHKRSSASRQVPDATRAAMERMQAYKRLIRSMPPPKAS